ncbi:MAG: type I-E CRISPR-associated protein Cse1/CasA [Kiritimatiellales bacterium]|nr:type I-E CRISPR-associated protein Cse1/CasA [Kiritimatiellales bacterium]
MEIPDESFIKPPTTLDATSKNGGTGLSELWDHISDARVFQDADTDLPLSLLCYLNFSCSGKIGKAQWRDTLFNGSTAAGPSHNYLHTYILGSYITDTIHRNLVPKDVVATSVVMGSPNKWGRPIWEQMPSTPDDDDAVLNAATTYLGRLVPLSRLVKFDKSPSRAVTCTIGPPPAGLKMTRLPTLREPAATVIWRTPDDPGYLLARAGRHVWRDLEAIFAVHRESGTLSLEPFLRHFVYPQAIEGFRVWIGGSVRGKNEGKYDDLVEWSALFKSSYFGDRSLAGYAAGITLAEFGKNCLFKAMNKYHKPNPDLPGTEKRQIPYRIAESIFWNTLDQHVDPLFDLLETNTKASSQKWDNCIHSALLSAYDQCCPHETPRQIEAYVQGRKILDGWKGEKNAA